MKSDNGNLVALVPVLKGVIQTQTNNPSVFSSPEKSSKATAEDIFSLVGPVGEPKVVYMGTGEAQEGFVFTQQPDAFNPQWVGRGSSVHIDLPAPQAPRRCSCTSTYLQGVAGENIQNLLVWAAPIVDSTGRWLETTTRDNSTLSLVHKDAILYYLIQREDLNTGEVITSGLVSHSRQIIHNVKTFIEAEHTAGRAGAVTDIYSGIATFDAALYQNVVGVDGEPIYDADGNIVTELCLPAGHEEYFEFLDATAIYGHTYKYLITAITIEQKEGVSRAVIPGSAVAAGGTEVAFAPAWCSTFPNVDAGATGSESYLDLTLQIGSLISDVDIALIPIQDNVLVINTDPPADTEPAIIETNPAEVLLYVCPVTTTQVIEFVGRNIELSGGISSLTLGNGISIKENGITKTQFGTSADWSYRISVLVEPAVSLGIKTMVITCADGRTVLCSQFKTVPGQGQENAGPEFTKPGETYRFLDDEPISFTIFGQRMDTIVGFTPSRDITDVSIVSVSENQIEIALTMFLGTVVLTPLLAEGKVRTMKDTCNVHVSRIRGGDPEDPSRYPDTSTSRSTPTFRST